MTLSKDNIENLTTGAKVRHHVLKNILNLLISKFGIREINDKLSAICYDEFVDSKNIRYDNLSEVYDLINEKYFDRYGNFRK